MSTTQPNPLFTRSEKGRFGRTMKKRVRGAARKGLSKIFGIPLSKGLGQPSSRRRAHRLAKPSSGSGPSTPVRSDVIAALREQGYTAGVAKRMAEGVRADDSFESAFRRVMARNPAELIIFGNPEHVYTRQGLIRAKRASNPIPAALISAFESAAGSKLFDEVTSGKKKSNSHRGGAEARRNGNPTFQAISAVLKRAGLSPASERLHKHGYGVRKFHGAVGIIFDYSGGTADSRTARRSLEAAGYRVEVKEDGQTLVVRSAKSKNPEGAGTERAGQLFEKFHHRGASGVFERQRSARQRKNYTILGPLVAIGINPEYFDKMEARAGAKRFADWAVEHYDQLPRLDFMTPGQVDQVKSILGDPAKYIQDCPLLASSPSGRQLYALAEDVQIDLSKFETDAGKDFVDLGDATFVVYIAKKPHEVREWVHMLGEHGGTRPRLMYDRLRKEVCFIGGSYVVKAPGIMH